MQHANIAERSLTERSAMLACCICIHQSAKFIFVNKFNFGFSMCHCTYHQIMFCLWSLKTGFTENVVKSGVNYLVTLYERAVGLKNTYVDLYNDS